MEGFKNPNSTEETSVLVQPLPQRPASSSSISISPCALGSGTAESSTLLDAQGSGSGQCPSRQPEQTALRRQQELLLLSPPASRPGAPAGRAGERQRSPRCSPCADARQLRSGHGRDGPGMGLAAECESACACIIPSTVHTVQYAIQYTVHYTRYVTLCYI